MSFGGWKFEEVERTFEELPQGMYRARIAQADLKKTQTGKDMVVLMLDVSGHYQKMFYNLVFDPQNPRITNQKLQSIHDSFGIGKDNYNFQSWVGKVGGFKTKLGKDQFGADRTEIHYFLNQTQLAKLPAWVEPNSGSDNGNANSTSGNTMETMDLPRLDDIQF